MEDAEQNHPTFADARQEPASVQSARGCHDEPLHELTEDDRDDHDTARRSGGNGSL
jgi:hypothetical protein